MTFEEMVNLLDFEKETAEAVLKQYRQNKKKISKIAVNAYHHEGWDFPLNRCHPLTRLTTVVYLLTSKYEDYKNFNVDDKIIFETFKDVSLRSHLYWKKTGKIGLAKEDVIWFRHLMNGMIFKIGVLQFQKFEMTYLDEELLGEPFMTFDDGIKQQLPSGTPVINCHIQRGADLSSDLVHQSFSDAEDFFKRHYPQVSFQAFLCYSWLLYPPMCHCLKEDSNIRQFASFFTIIGTCNDLEEPDKNLFENGIKNCHKPLTSLQKLRISHPDLFGFACGIHFIKK